MTKTIRIGTRASALAMAQAGEIRRLLRARHPRLGFRLVKVKTEGDEFQSVELFKRNKIGVFTKAIEKKLLEKEIDIAVHSLKDLPTKLPAGLCLAAFAKRADPSDVLVTRQRLSLRSLPKGAEVGTGSPRRKRQLTLLRPDLKLLDIRGNLDTRIAQVLREKKLDAIVVAKAGLARLKKYQKYAHPLRPDQMLPAVGQGILGLEVRSRDTRAVQVARSVNDAPTETAARSERAFLKALGGGCRVPVGIYSQVKGGKIFLKAAIFSVKSDDSLSGQLSGPRSKPEKIGKELARRLLKKGAKKFLSEARQTA